MDGGPAAVHITLLMTGCCLLLSVGGRGACCSIHYTINDCCCLLLSVGGRGPAAVHITLLMTVVVCCCQLVDGGLLQYRFDCGSGPGFTRVDSINVNDGYWHSIVIERLGKNAKIIIDGTHTAHGSAPGTNDVLNLDSNDVFFGAEVITMANGREDISQGFIGCMRDFVIDEVKLPMAGSSSVALFKNTHNIEFHCRGAYIPGRVCLCGGRLQAVVCCCDIAECIVYKCCGVLLTPLSVITSLWDYASIPPVLW